MMKTIAILGGSFNPITLGHTQIATIVSSFCDRVWIQPCYQHMHGKNLIDAKHRVKMCHLALDSLNNTTITADLKSRISVSEYEIKNKLTGSTYEIIQHLKENCPKFKFYMVIGQDNADSIEKWKNPEELISSTPFIVFPRKGYRTKDNPNAWYKKAPHCFLGGFAQMVVQCSSTEVREMIRVCYDSSFVAPEVLQYIRANKLYMEQK